MAGRTVERSPMGPAPDDLIITPLPGHRVTFAVGSASGGPQLLVPAFDRALARAMEFSRRIRVDVWYAEDGRTPRVIARHRQRRRHQGGEP